MQNPAKSSVQQAELTAHCRQLQLCEMVFSNFPMILLVNFALSRAPWVLFRKPNFQPRLSKRLPSIVLLDALASGKTCECIGVL